MVRAVTFDVGYTLLQRKIFPLDRWFAERCRLAGMTLSSRAALEGARAWVRFEVANPDSRANPITQRWLRERAVAGLRAAGVVGNDEDGILERFRAAGSQMETGWRLDPDVPAILEALRQRGLRLGVVSNWNATLREDLEAIGIARHFDSIVDSASAGTEKPDRRIYELSCADLGVPAAECVHVGDSPPHDVAVARAVGATPILYDPLQCLEGDCIRIERLMDLVGALDGG